MNNRSYFLAAASVLAMLASASTASAADNNGTYLAVSVGSTSIEQTDGGPSPNGTVIDVRLGDVLFVYDGWSIAAEAGASYSNASASEQGTFCLDIDCYDVGTWTDKYTSKWSGTLGVRVFRPVGLLIVSGTAGVRVAEFTRTSHYDNAGVYPNETYEDTSVAFGGYYGVNVDYPVNDRWSVGIGWQHSDPVEAKWSGPYGKNELGFSEETWTVGFHRKL